MQPSGKSTRTTRSTANPPDARLHGPPSLRNLPTEIKKMIVSIIGVRLERTPSAPATSETRRTLKSLALMDKVYATLVPPYLFQAIKCTGKHATSSNLIFFHDNVLPRFQPNITSLLFHRGTADRPTSDIREAAARITGTSHEECDGEEIFSSLLANLISKIPNLDTVAFDFHPSQPRDRVQCYEGNHWSSTDTAEQIRAKRTPKPRAGSNKDFVLAALQAKSAQITSLDINLDSCPQSSYGALATFLIRFRQLRSLRLADPVETRRHDGNREERDDIGRGRLFRAIASFGFLESLSLVHLSELMDDSLCTHVVWPGWTNLPLKSLTIIEADGLGLETLIEFTNSFSKTLKSLTLSQCPRAPEESYRGFGSSSQDSEIDDESALDVARFDLPELEGLTLGRQFLSSEDLFPLFEDLTMEHITIGARRQYRTKEYYDFAEEHEETLKCMTIRVEKNWGDEQALQLQEDLQDDFGVRCDLSWRREMDELDDFHWPVDPVFA
ncbi:hypothetical protein P7C70_g1596, partial [Phenoliferia sp. Uapishka_3]